MAHATSRTGGEFVLKHAGDLDYVEREWLTPAEDMAAIYARTGRTAVTPDDISFCMQLGFLGIWANRVRGDGLAWRVAAVVEGFSPPRSALFRACAVAHPVSARAHHVWLN